MDTGEELITSGSHSEEGEFRHHEGDDMWSGIHPFQETNASGPKGGIQFGLHLWPFSTDSTSSTRHDLAWQDLVWFQARHVVVPSRIKYLFNVGRSS